VRARVEPWKPRATPKPAPSPVVATHPAPSIQPVDDVFALLIQVDIVKLLLSPNSPRAPYWFVPLNVSAEAPVEMRVKVGEPPNPAELPREDRSIHVEPVPG